MVSGNSPGSMSVPLNFISYFESLLAKQSKDFATTMTIFCEAYQRIFAGRSKRSRANRQAFGLPLFFESHISGGFGQQISAAAGCRLCALLWEKLSPAEWAALYPTGRNCPLSPVSLKMTIGSRSRAKLPTQLLAWDPRWRLVFLEYPFRSGACIFGKNVYYWQ